MRLRGVGSGLPGTSARYERRLVVTPCAVETVGSVMHGGVGLASSGTRGSRCRRLREDYNGVVEDVYIGVSRRHRRAGLLGFHHVGVLNADRVLGATPPRLGRDATAPRVDAQHLLQHWLHSS